MALIGAILVEIKINKFLCERALRGGNRYAMKHGTALAENGRTWLVELSRTLRLRNRQSA